MTQNTQNFNSLPSLVEIKNIINEIETSDFSQLSYNKLIQKIKTLVFIPFTTTILKKGHFIERARINKTDQIFYSEKELSYRTDYENIKSYGRANVPHNSLFYGAFKSDIIEHPRFINLLETSEIFRNLNENTVSQADFVMTVGKWQILNDIEIVEVAFDENSIENSPDVKRAFEHHSEKLKKELPEFIEQFEFILKFFSNQFAKKEIKSHFDYIVSAAYTDLAMNWRGFPGITYPSVKADYIGQNIVLSPMAVEQNLKLEIAAMFRVIKDGLETVVIPVKHCTEFGSMNTKFVWLDSNKSKITT